MAKMQVPSKRPSVIDQLGTPQMVKAGQVNG
jgi:hypothetical protein